MEEKGKNGVQLEKSIGEPSEPSGGLGIGIISKGGGACRHTFDVAVP